MSDLVQTSIMLPRDTYDRLRIEAFQRKTSRSRLIDAALLQYFDTYGPAESREDAANA